MPARWIRWRPESWLPIALGEATKTVPYLVEADKTYRFTVAWGATTASFDREGAVTATSGVRPSPRTPSPRRCEGLRRPDRADSAGLFRDQGRWRAGRATWPGPASKST